jgi:hypothetical protein
MIVKATNVQLPLGEGGTIWFDTPMTPPKKLERESYRGSAIVVTSDMRYRPRHLAFEIAAQLYGFFDYSDDAVPFSARRQIIFAEDDFSVRLSGLRAYLQVLLKTPIASPSEDVATSTWWFAVERFARRQHVGVSRELVAESGIDEDELYSLLDSMRVESALDQPDTESVLLTTNGIVA